MISIASSLIGVWTRGNFFPQCFLCFTYYIYRVPYISKPQPASKPAFKLFPARRDVVSGEGTNVDRER